MQPTATNRIMIIEDVKDMRELLSAVVRPYDPKPLQRETYDSVVSYFSQHEREDIDLVLLDLNLHGDNGLKLIKQITQSNRENPPKIFCVTGDKEKETVIRAIKMGATDYICKPIDVAVVRHKIEHHLREKKEQLFTKIPTKLKVEFPIIPLPVTGIVTELSELGCKFEAALPFEIKSSIIMVSNTINNSTNSDIELVAKIVSATQEGDKHIFDCEFVGMKEDSLQKIRSLVVQGKEIFD